MPWGYYFHRVKFMNLRRIVPENARKRDMILCGNAIVVAKHRSTGTCSNHFSGADFSSSNKCVSLAVSPCIGPWPTGRVSCRPCELCCCDARCRYGGTAASDDEWDWWLGPRATADWMGDEKTGATKLPGWSEKGLLLTEKKAWNTAGTCLTLGGKNRGLCIRFLQLLLGCFWW